MTVGAGASAGAAAQVVAQGRGVESDGGGDVVERCVGVGEQALRGSYALLDEPVQGCGAGGGAETAVQGAPRDAGVGVDRVDGPWLFELCGQRAEQPAERGVGVRVNRRGAGEAGLPTCPGAAATNSRRATICAAAGPWSAPIRYRQASSTALPPAAVTTIVVLVSSLATTASGSTRTPGNLARNARAYGQCTAARRRSSSPASARANTPVPVATRRAPCSAAVCSSGPQCAQRSRCGSGTLVRNTVCAVVMVSSGWAGLTSIPPNPATGAFAHTRTRYPAGARMSVTAAAASMAGAPLNGTATTGRAAPPPGPAEPARTSTSPLPVARVPVPGTVTGRRGMGFRSGRCTPGRSTLGVRHGVSGTGPGHRPSGRGPGMPGRARRRHRGHRCEHPCPPSRVVPITQRRRCRDTDHGAGGVRARHMRGRGERCRRGRRSRW